MRLGDIVREIVGGGDGQGDGAAERDAAELDLAQLYAHAKAMRLPEARFEAWDRIGNMEVQRRDMQAALDAFQIAWKNVPEQRAFDWSSGVAGWIIERAEERTSPERKFALELAQAGAKLAEGYVREEQGQEPPSDEQKAFLAGTLNLLAWAYHVNGKHDKAVATAMKCLELCEEERFRADLEKFRNG